MSRLARAPQRSLQVLTLDRLSSGNSLYCTWPSSCVPHGLWRGRRTDQRLHCCFPARSIMAIISRLVLEILTEKRKTMNDKIGEIQHGTALRIIGLSDRGEITLSIVERILKEHDALMQALLIH